MGIFHILLSHVFFKRIGVNKSTKKTGDAGAEITPEAE
jgi:hypothetical protein